MEFGVTIFPTHYSAQPAEIAAAAEKLGFESFFVSEHSHIPLSTEFALGGETPMVYRSMYDPFVALGAAAAATTRIKLGTAITIIPQHNPVNCAKAVSTIDQLSGGRMVFGIGAGWNPPEMEHHGVAFKDRFKVTREYLGVMKELWTKEEASFAGETFTLNPSWQWPKPVQQPHPPVLIAGSGPNILKRVVALGDGWMPVLTPQWHDSLEGKVVDLNKLPDMMAETRKLEEQAGKERTTITAMGLPPTAEFVDQLSELGVERMVFSLSADSRDEGFETLNNYANALAQYLK